MEGQPTVGRAVSGDGEVETVVIGCMRRLNFQLEACQALFLTSTRELAQHIQLVATAVGAHSGAKCHACTSGKAGKNDRAKLEEGQHIVASYYRSPKNMSPSNKS